jgi:hypothetical protein
MSNTPTPDTGTSLSQRIEDHREDLLVLMVDTERCDDITSGIEEPLATP